MASGMIDFADELFLRLVRRMSLQALGAAAERRDRALAHVIGVERGDQRQAAALLCRRGLGGGLGGSGGADDAAGAAADLARTFVLVGDVGGDAGARAAVGTGAAAGRCRRGLGLGFAETLLGFEFGLALGFLVLPVAVFLGLAAGFGGFALGLLDAFLAVAALGFLFREPALFDVADLGVGQRAGARGTLVLGQGAQHHARIAARRGWRRGGTGERRLGGRGLGDNRLRRVRASVTGASPPMRRLPRFSTTTCLVRPWLKLWRTVPVSTRGLSVKVLVGTLSVLSPGVFVSTIQQS